MGPVRSNGSAPTRPAARIPSAFDPQRNPPDSILQHLAAWSWPLIHSQGPIASPRTDRDHFLAASGTGSQPHPRNPMLGCVSPCTHSIIVGCGGLVKGAEREFGDGCEGEGEKGDEFRFRGVLSVHHPECSRAGRVVKSIRSRFPPPGRSRVESEAASQRL